MNITTPFPRPPSRASPPPRASRLSIAAPRCALATPPHPQRRLHTPTLCRPLALQRLWPGRSPCIHRLASTWNPHAGARRACAVAVALGVKRDVSAHRSTKRRRIKREPACRGSACTAAVALAVAAACPDAHHSTHCVAPGRVPGSSCPWRARRVARERRAGQVWGGNDRPEKKKTP